MSKVGVDTEKSSPREAIPLETRLWKKGIPQKDKFHIRSMPRLFVPGRKGGVVLGSTQSYVWQRHMATFSFKIFLVS